VKPGPKPEPSTPEPVKPAPAKPKPLKPVQVKPLVEAKPARPLPVKPYKPNPLAAQNVKKVPDYKLYQAGLNAIKSGQKLSALVYWSKLVELQPKRNAVRYKLGMLLAETGYKAEAIGHFKAILKNHPRHQGAKKALQKLNKSQ
jgi:TolA-binding protein